MTEAPTEGAPRPPFFGPSLLLLIGIAGISTASLWARGSSAGGAELAFRRLILTVPILWLLARGRGTAQDPWGRGALWVVVSAEDGKVLRTWRG